MPDRHHLPLMQPVSGADLGPLTRGECATWVLPCGLKCPHRIDEPRQAAPNVWKLGVRMSVKWAIGDRSAQMHVHARAKVRMLAQARPVRVVGHDGEELVTVSPWCALDFADRGGMVQPQVGRALGITKQRVEQIERVALEAYRKKTCWVFPCRDHASGVLIRRRPERTTPFLNAGRPRASTGTIRTGVLGILSNRNATPKEVAEAIGASEASAHKAMLWLRGKGMLRVVREASNGAVKEQAVWGVVRSGGDEHRKDGSVA